jgi:hypothetical protein
MTPSVAENTTAVGTYTSAVSATWTLSGADAALFSITAGPSTSASLAFLVAPNFEAPADVGGSNSYSVTITATSALPSVGTMAVSITVTNVNETAPSITSNGGGASASISVVENTTAVTTVVATDTETVTYSISGGADAALFQIEPASGALSFISPRNFESPSDVGTNNIYEVIVQASDGTLTDTQAISVTITNANEAPTITSNGGGASASISIVENTTAVTTVTATDVDSGATQTYSISGGVDAARFAINSSTGVLTFVTAPDFEAPTDVGGDNVYQVTVQVTDGTLTDTQEISVTVTNASDGTFVIDDYSESLASDPPTFSFTSARAGTWRWDFHSAATAPAAGSGDIATGTASISSGANPSLSIDLSAFAGQTGYIYHRVIDGADVSNIIQSGIITTAGTPISLVGSAANVSLTSIGPITGQLAGDLIVISSYRAAGTAAPTLGTGFTNVLTQLLSVENQNARLQYRIATADGETFSGFTSATALVCEVFRGASGIGGAASNISDVHSVPTIPALTPIGGAQSWRGAAILPRNGATYNPGSCGPFTLNANAGSRWTLTHGPTSTFSAQAATTATTGASLGHIAISYEVLT